MFLDAANAKVFKLTRKGMYGELYYLVNNLMHQRNCAPVEYLLRLRIWKKIFQSALRGTSELQTRDKLFQLTSLLLELSRHKNL